MVWKVETAWQGFRLRSDQTIVGFRRWHHPSLLIQQDGPETKLGCRGDDLRTATPVSSLLRLFWHHGDETWACSSADSALPQGRFSYTVSKKKRRGEGPSESSMVKGLIGWTDFAQMFAESQPFRKSRESMSLNLEIE